MTYAKTILALTIITLVWFQQFPWWTVAIILTLSLVTGQIHDLFIHLYGVCPALEAKK